MELRVVTSSVLTQCVVLLLACAAHLTQAYNGCYQGWNCKLPDCFCPTFYHPLGSQNIPQIVYFGFDDAVQSTVSGFYRELFTRHRRNPNNCRITMSLFASDAYTSYTSINEFFKLGDEIGVHSVSHVPITTPSALRQEAMEQKENIADYGAVPIDKIIGWRSPNLITIGDDQPRILKELNYTYDISLTYSQDLNNPFPFTLDYGNPYPCTVPPCPGPYSRHKGFWEVMIRSFFDPERHVMCGYVDGCRPTTEEKALEYLWQNFIRSYETTRAPFGLNMHAAWFAFPKYMKAMQKFIDLLVQRDDVWIVSVSQMLEWVKNPVPLSEIKYFAPFGCKESNYTTTTSKTTTTTRSTTTTTTPTTTTTTTSTTKPTTTTTTTTKTTTPKNTTFTTTQNTTSTTTTTTTDQPTSNPRFNLLSSVKTQRKPAASKEPSYLQSWYQRIQDSGPVQRMSVPQEDSDNYRSPTRAIMAP